MSARTLALFALAANAALLLAWYGWLAPVERLPRWLVLATMLAPAVPGLLLALRRRASAAFWAGLAALFYFSHGVMEAWADPGVRWLASAEIVLGLAMVAGASWDGLRARFARKPA